MNRTRFIKSLLTLMAAPSIVGATSKSIQAFKIDVKETSEDRVTYYTENLRGFREGDHVISDVKDSALVTKIVAFGDGFYITFRGFKAGKFNYKNPANMKLIVKARGKK